MGNVANRLAVVSFPSVVLVNHISFCLSTLPHNFSLLTKSRADIPKEDVLCPCVCFSVANLSLSTGTPGKYILSLTCAKHPSSSAQAMDLTVLSMACIYCQYLPVLWKGHSCVASSSSLLSVYMGWKHSLHGHPLPVH